MPCPPSNESMTMRNDLTIYDKVAANWWSDDIRWVRTLKNLVPGRLAWMDRQIGWAGKDVLDLGCAGGFMAEALAERDARVTGIDPASEAIAAARAHAAQIGHQIRYDVGVGEDLPYDDAAFDAVVCVDVLEHVQDLPRVLAEVARVLRPGGLFLFDTINRNPLARLATITVAEDILRLLPRGTHDPDMFIKPSELRDALRAAGLEPGRFTGLGPRGVNRRLDLTFGPLPLTTILYMGSAKKHEGASPIRLES
jgi:2-polyprenyl-6-hydroxyphenyl methylase / 3-demethylubiquinone-9 3-methyltransferase